MEVEDYVSKEFTFGASEYFVTKEILGGHFSQVLDLSAAMPEQDLIVYWAGNNDALEAAYGGLTIQAKLTPLEQFNRNQHKADLRRLAAASKLNPTIPHIHEEFIDIALDFYESMTVLGETDAGDPKPLNILSMEGAFVYNVKMIRAGQPKADIVAVTLANISIIPVTFELGNGTVKKGFKKGDDFPYGITIGGLDITDRVRNSELRLNKRDDEDRETAEKWDAKDRVSLFRLLSRLSDRAGAEDLIILDALLGEGSFVERLLQLPLLPFRALRLAGVGIATLFGGARTAVKGLRNEIANQMFSGPLSFRDDEVLTEPKQQEIQNRIKDFNALVVKRYSTRMNLNYTVMDLGDVFAQATKPTADGGEEGHLIPELNERIFARMNGGIFSLDSVHPGPLAHAAFSTMLLKKFREVAGARVDRRFRGLHRSEIRTPTTQVLQDARKNDPVQGRK